MADVFDLEQPEIPKGAMLVRADAKAIGAVTAHTCRASQDSWNTFGSGRVRGFADSTSDIDTVLCYNLYNDSPPEVREVSSFRKGGSSKSKAKVSERKVTEVERMGLVNNIGADFS